MKKILRLILCIIVLATTRLFAQTHTVTGTVTAKDDGMPVIGASVLVKGTTTGTQTDVRGKYTLSVPIGGVLTFSFVGYAPQQVPITDNVINVVLLPENLHLGEVVVTGYQTKTRADNNSAVSIVDPKAIADKPIPGIDNLLQGQAAGVQITTENGRPGANAFIRIRGTGSVNAGDQPLLVVDGVQIPDNVAPEFYNTLNANDIANISILKDAASASLYGARGSNGVIVITTETGGESANKVSYTFQYGTNRKIPDNFQMMNAAQKLGYEADLGFTNGDIQTYLVGKGLPDNVTLVTPAQLQDAQNALIAQGHNWQNDILRSGQIVQHQLTLSGHSDKTNYYVSFEKYDEDGISVGSNLSKYSGKINLSTEVKPWLTLSNNLNLAERSTNEVRDRNNAQSPFVAMYLYNPYEPVFLPDGSYNPTSQGFSVLEGVKNNPEIRKYVTGYNTTTLDLHPIKGLHISTQLGLTLNDYQRQYYVEPGSILDGYTGDPTAPGFKTDDGSREFNYDWVNKATYKFDIGSDHHFNVLAVQEFQKDQFTSYSLNSKGYPDPNLSTQDNAAANASTNSTTQSIYTIASLLGELDYNYKGKYFATGSFRRDGSSKFGTNHQYGNFESGSIGWLISGEDFMKNAKWVNLLKLRVSIGNTGNFSSPSNFNPDDFTVLNNYQALGLNGFGKYNDKSTTIPTQVANPDLTWEKKLKKDIGVDFELLNSRLTGSFEYYDENTTGLLFQLPTSQTVGYSSVFKNVGAMYNKGIDFSISGDIIRTHDLKRRYHQDP
jgi:TonB-linked SusC/RagA family outer membrane protein